MYSNRITLTKRSFEPIFDFLQTYTYSRCINQANASCYLSNFVIQQPDIFNIRQVQSEQGNCSARNNLNDLDDQNFTDQQDNIDIRAQKIDNNNRYTEDDSLKQTAYFSEGDSQFNYYQNVNDMNVVKEEDFNKEEKEDENQNQSLKSKLLMKLIKQKTKKKNEMVIATNGKIEQQKMDDDISYLKKLRKHCNLR